MFLNKFINKYKKPLAICLLTKISLLIFSFFAFQIFTQQTISSPSQFLEIWNRWDSQHYLFIAENGYRSTPLTNMREDVFIVFLPFYPFLVKIFSFVTFGNFILAGMIVSFLGSIFASILLYRLAIENFGEKNGARAVWFLNIFPTSYFMLSGYTESVFLALSLGGYLAIYKKRVFVSSLVGFLAGLTRLNSFLLITLTGRSRKLSDVFYPISILGGFSVYLLLNWSLFKNPFYFLSVLYDHWYKSFSFPWVGIKNSIAYALQHDNFREFLVFSQEPIYLISLLILGLYILIRVRKPWGIYIISSFLLFSSTSFILSTPRYSLVLFPIYIILATWTNNKFLFIVFTFISGAFLLFFNTLFVMGQWAF